MISQVEIRRSVKKPDRWIWAIVLRNDSRHRIARVSSWKTYKNALCASIAVTRVSDSIGARIENETVLVNQKRIAYQGAIVTPRGNVEIVCVDIRGNKVRIGIDMLRESGLVHRGEVYAAIERKKRSGA